MPAKGKDVTCSGIFTSAAILVAEGTSLRDRQDSSGIKVKCRDIMMLSGVLQ